MDNISSSWHHLDEVNN